MGGWFLSDLSQLGNSSSRATVTGSGMVRWPESAQSDFCLIMPGEG